MNETICWIRSMHHEDESLLKAAANKWGALPECMDIRDFEIRGTFGHKSPALFFSLLIQCKMARYH